MICINAFSARINVTTMYCRLRGDDKGKFNVTLHILATLKDVFNVPMLAAVTTGSFLLKTFIHLISRHFSKTLVYQPFFFC